MTWHTYKTFGGTWHALGDNIALELTCGFFDTELGYCAISGSVQAAGSLHRLTAIAAPAAECCQWKHCFSSTKSGAAFVVGAIPLLQTM